MAAKRTVRGALAGVLLVATAVGAACTKDSDGDPVTTRPAVTTIPDEQKPPMLRESWTQEDLEQLAEIVVAEYSDEETDLTGMTLTRVFVSEPNPDGVTLAATVRLAPCDPYECWDLDQEPDAEHLAYLRSFLLPAFRDDPDRVFEYGTDELIGDFETFTLYWRSFLPDENDSAIGYYALYHDGLNRIQVSVSPQGASKPTDDETLEQGMPEEWAREVTADVLAAFADEFNVDR